MDLAIYSIAREIFLSYLWEFARLLYNQWYIQKFMEHYGIPITLFFFFLFFNMLVGLSFLLPHSLEIFHDKMTQRHFENGKIDKQWNKISTYFLYRCLRSECIRIPQLCSPDSYCWFLDSPKLFRLHRRPIKKVHNINAFMVVASVSITTE